VTDNPKADCLLPLQRGQEKAMLHTLRVSLFVVLLSALSAAAAGAVALMLIGGGVAREALELVADEGCGHTGSVR